MSTEMLIAIVAGVFSLGGAAIGAGLTLLGSFLEHRRREKRESEDAENRERAIFHGAFAVCNFIAGKLNEWDRGRNVPGLIRLSVAQPYLAKLIDRSPPDSERLMVSLIALGLRLEALTISADYATNAADRGDPVDYGQIENEIENLAAAVEVVQIILDGELEIMGEEELAKIPGFLEATAEQEVSRN